MRQAHFQHARNALLYGISPETGEGILNGPGTFETNFPADSNGTTLRTMSPGYVAQTLNYMLMDIVTRTNQLGKPTRMAIVAPQRVIGLLQSQIVPLTSWQNIGGGSNTIAGTVTSSLQQVVSEISWLADDTLIGKGANGADMMIASIPEVQLRAIGMLPDTNIFGSDMATQENACSIQLWDAAAPVEYPVPVPGGDLDVVTELKLTPGWVLRPETVTKISVWVDEPPASRKGS